MGAHLDSRQVLPTNAVLDGSYRILGVVGAGGFGITYKAEDSNLGTLVAIKEYYPAEFADRDATMSVRPKSERHSKTFEWGRSSFLQEARMLARFRHPTIVQVTRVFEAYSTAYMVMMFEHGQDLGTWLKGLGRPPTQEELDRIAAPLLDALEMIHAANFLHRDIAPDNVIIRPDGTPVLLDFGAARRAVAEASRALTGIVKAGYSPHEQYSSDSRLQGPWSDIYAVGATLYRAVTGRAPEEATLRFDVDSMPPATRAAKGAYRPAFLEAIDACLKVRPSERPQSVAELRARLLGPQVQGKGRLVDAGRQAEEVVPGRTGTSRWGIAAAIVLVLLGGGYGGYEFRQWNAAKQEEARREAQLAAQRQAALEADQRRREQEAMDARQRQIEAEDAQRRKELADAAEARRRAEAAAEAKRKEEEARRKDAESRQQAVAEEEAKRKETQRTAALEDARRSEEQRKQNVPGTPILLQYYSSWDGNCASRPLPTVSINGAPANGRIEFKTEMRPVKRVNFGNDKCLGTVQRSRVIYYVPMGSPVANDRVSFFVRFFGGNSLTRSCVVNAVSRTAQCN